MILDWKIFTPTRELCEFLDKVVPIGTDKDDVVMKGIKQIFITGYIVGITTGLVIGAMVILL